MLKSLTRAILAFAFAAAVVSQGTGTLALTTGGIQGSVSDLAGNPIVGVNVSVVAPSYSTSTTTKADGFYAVAGLPPDTYTLTFSKEGLQTEVVPGETISQDQTLQVNVHLQKTVKTLATIPVRAATSLIQPKSTADVYTINEQAVQNITGTPQNISESAVLNSLPGITTDRSGYPIIRGGLENDEGYQLEGIDVTEPVTGQFINSLSLNGTSRLVISTGGYDASSGNTNSGVINEVIKRGAYPGAGRSTIDVNAPNFDHRLAFEYGNATSDNRFSYFLSFNGLRQFRVYGDQHTFSPALYGATGFSSGNDDLVNLFFRFGKNNSNELQYFATTGANLFSFNYENGTNVTLGQCGGFGPVNTFLNTPTTRINGPGPDSCFPYDTANFLTLTQTDVCERLGFAVFPGTCGTVTQDGRNPLALSTYTTLYPGQINASQPIGFADGENNNHFIESVNFKHQFGPATFGEVRGFRTSVHDIFLTPWNGGAFGGEFEHNISDNWGIGADFTSQLNSKHELSFGGESIFTKPRFDINLPVLLEVVTQPLESTGCVFTNLNFIGGGTPTTPGGCYIAPLNAAMNAGLWSAIGVPSFLIPFVAAPTDAAHAPMNTYADSASTVFDFVHRNDVWLLDRWAPSDRWTVTPSVRWDQEVINLPANAQALSGGYVFCCQSASNPNGTLAQIPAAPITTAVTRPAQISPRLALSFQAGGNDVLRASYGRFIEFTPTSNIVNVYRYVPTSLRSCNLTSGCFQALPGYDPACVNGMHGTARCNNINNLYDQIIMDLNQNDFAQYTPVLPQRATAADLTWEHAFANGFELKITPYWRKGTDYVVANQPLLFTLADGTPVFGAPHEENAGINTTTGVEFSFQRNVKFGWSGFLNGTYDNTLANYNSDFFPSTNAAALALHHFFHVSYLAPITATGNVNFHARNGWIVNMTIPYESGYRYGVGKHTFVFLPTGPGGALVPTEVLNTDIAAASLGLLAASSAYYFTDPVNPGTLDHPNIIGSRGTADGNDPGTIHGIGIARVNIAIAKDMGFGSQTVQVGARLTNVFGNYTPIAPGSNSRYRNNGFGAFGPTSGGNVTFPVFENGQFPRSPLPFNYDQTGSARLLTVYFSTKY